MNLVYADSKKLVYSIGNGSPSFWASALIAASNEERRCSGNPPIFKGFNNLTDEGHLIEMVVWRVPDRVPPCKHPYKYRLVYIVESLRVIGYDNERGKGDHRHVDGIETPYKFVSIEQLIDDFIEDVKRRRNV